MLRPPKMDRVHALGSKKVLPELVERLYSLRELHVIDFEEDDFFERGGPMEGASDVSSRLVRVRSLLDRLGIEGIPAERMPRPEVEDTLDDRFPEVRGELSELFSRREEARRTLREKRDLIAELEPFASIPVDFQDYSGYSSLEVYVGKIYGEPDLEGLRRAEWFTSSGDGYTLVALFVAEEEAPDADKILSGVGFQAVEVPMEEGDPGDVVRELREEIHTLEGEIVDVEAEIEEFRRREGSYLMAVEEYLSMDSEKKELPLRVAESENTFVIDGWIPAESTERLREEVESVDDRILFEVLETADDEEEDVPVAFGNYPAASPFEIFTDMFGRPSYREVDPTVMIAVAFPVIYGMVLGDVGYGLGGLALSLYLIKKTDGALRSLGYPLALASASSVVFGVVYAEALGPVALGLTWSEWANGMLGFHALPLIERNLFDEHVQIPMLVMLSIWVGIIQVSLGFLLGFYNSLVSDHSLSHAVMHDLSWFLLMLGLLGGIVSVFDVPLMPVLPLPAVYPFLGIVAASVVMIVMGEGPIGLMEIPSRIFSHTFSFTRIAAIGLSSVGIALVINMFSEMIIFEVGGVFAIAGVLLYVVGHLANLVLGLFASTLHSIRLQWVEFFTKFYEGGGKKFHPFGRTTEYMEEM